MRQQAKSRKHIKSLIGRYLPVVAPLALLGVLAVYPTLATLMHSAYAEGSGSASLSTSYSAEQNINISLDKTNVGITATSTDFGKMLTDNFNVTVSTNNSTGYVLNMAVDSSATNGATITSGGTTQENVATNALVNTADNRYYIPSIAAAVTNPTDATFPANSWAYSISTAPADMAYSPLPEAGSSAEIKRVTSLTLEEDADGNLTADDVTPVTVATKADMTIPAGTYTNKLIFTAVTNFNPEYDSYTIVYDRNGTAGDGTSGTVGGDMTMVSHTGVHSGDAVMLYAPNYWRSGYGFLGWSSVADATKYVPSTQASLGAGESYVYGPNETITLSDAEIATATADGTITMHAIWKASEGNMQGWTGCSSMSVGDVTALTDTRDDNVYAVAKLADGKCWFSENLRLSSGTVDATTTNNPVENFAWTESTNSWCTDDNATCDNKAVINTNNLNSSLAASPTTNNNSSSWYGYGTMYNWYAATAGNGTYEKSSGNVSGDICPLSWHLPTSASTGEFQAMYTAIGATPANILKYPNNFVLSGHWDGPSATVRGSYGRYLSSTASSNFNAYGLYLYSSYVGPSGNYNKYFGDSVRCVAGGYPYTITYDANGGAGTMNPQSSTYGSSVTLTSNAFTRTNYTFLGWSTDKNATAATYTNGQTLSTGLPNTGASNVTLYAVWQPVVTYVYNVNGGTAITDLGNQTVNAGTSAMLKSPNYSRANYGFAGWNTKADGSGTNYGPEETITAPSTPQTINLYARWIASAGNMQSWTGCSSMTTGTITARKDTRDNNVYAIAKLGDNKCWMIENLRLSSGAINSSTTHNPVSGFALGSSDSNWCDKWSADCIDRVNWSNRNSTTGYYSYGNYYDWYAATAGHGKYATTSGNTAGDICPAGWHLPTGNDGEYKAMVTAVGGSSMAIRKSPYNFVLSGIINPNRREPLVEREVSGFYWSSTANSSEVSAYNMYFERSRDVYQLTLYKYEGMPVRCIAG